MPPPRIAIFSGAYFEILVVYGGVGEVDDWEKTKPSSRVPGLESRALIPATSELMPYCCACLVDVSKDLMW
jgi:hypothetical protein